MIHRYAGAIVLLGIITGGVIYTSDVWRTKVGTQIAQFEEWTPENIAKYPDDYLNFCENQVNKALTDLKARQISIAQAKATVTDMRDDSQQKVAIGEKVLAELKGMYSKANTSNAWPAMWENQPRDEQWTRLNIEQVYAQLQGKRKLLATSQSALDRLDAQDARIPAIQSQALQQLADIKTNREILKINKLTDDLNKQLVSLKGMVQGVVTTASESPEIINLDDLKATSAGAATAAGDSDFQKIMAEKSSTPGA